MVLSIWPKEKDAFATDVEDWMIGTGSVTLRTLGYLIDIRDSTVLISDVKGANEGILRVSVSAEILGIDPIEISKSCTDPKFLEGKDIKICVKVHGAIGLRWTKGPMYCTYSFWKVEEQIEENIKNSASNENKNTIQISPIAHNWDSPNIHRTKVVPNSHNPEFCDEHTFLIRTATADFVEFISHDSLKIDIWGIHDEEIVQKTYQPRPSRPPSRTESEVELTVLKQPLMKRAKSASLLGDNKLQSVSLINSPLEANSKTIITAAAISATTEEFLSKIRDTLTKATTKEELNEMKKIVKNEIVKVQKRENKGKQREEKEATIRQKQEKQAQELQLAKAEIERQANQITKLQNGLKNEQENSKTLTEDEAQKIQKFNLENIREAITLEIRKVFLKQGILPPSGGLNPLQSSKPRSSVFQTLDVVPESSGFFDSGQTSEKYNEITSNEIKKLQIEQIARLHKLNSFADSIVAQNDLTELSKNILIFISEIKDTSKLAQDSAFNTESQGYEVTNVIKNNISAMAAVGTEAELEISVLNNLQNILKISRSNMEVEMDSQHITKLKANFQSRISSE
ncbi:hypothetical protein HK096_008789, partial [Nowakowskiella sp. JEL0078]